MKYPLSYFGEGETVPSPHNGLQQKTHHRMWAAAQFMYQHARETESPAFYLSAMIFARLTADAYCNFAMSILDPPTFSCQKLRFNNSVTAKAEWVQGAVGIKVKPHLRPLLTLKQLDELRDLAVRGHPQFEHAALHADDSDRLFYFAPGIDQFLSMQNCKQTFIDVENFCNPVNSRLISRLTHKNTHRESVSHSDGLQPN